MMAFTRLSGYVRFFHPSDSVVTANWHLFLANGLRVVESATTPDSLTRALRTLFAGVAPTMRIDRVGTPPHSPVPAAAGNAVAFWAHRGVSLATSVYKEQTLYSSTRVIAASVAAGQPASTLLGKAFPDPNRPERIDLGAGVAAVMPVALRVAMPAVPEARRLAPKTFSSCVSSADDRFTRLAAVAELWMVMEHFYPYWDVVDTDWWATMRSGLLAASRDKSASDFTVTLQRMVATLHDGHGGLSHNARPRPWASYGVVLRVVEGDVMVTRVMDTARTDVRRGDVVLEIDGRPSSTVLAEQTSLESSATPQFAEYLALLNLMWGFPGDTRTVRVRSAESPAAPVRTVTLRAREMTSVRDTPDDLRPEKVAELAPGVLYVHLGKISDAEFVALLPRLQRASGLVFDLRGYPSFDTRLLLPRLSDSTITSARFELPVRSLPGTDAVTFQNSPWILTPIRPRLRAKVAFLTDGRAISYAESTMGIVEAYKLGEIVGEPTAGTNGNINPFMLPGGFRVTWTGLRVRKHDGSPHHAVGIMPTIPASATKRGVLAGRDEQLEAALAVVRSARRSSGA
ncbi:S41 family peptidase [Gemmatimonas sp.]|uniref:S41 family peptidase n=1 Tax=Gemmatimonas sp. TaxID=1962908 RepID=UPI0033415041